MSGDVERLLEIDRELDAISELVIHAARKRTALMDERLAIKARMTHADGLEFTRLRGK